MSLLVLENVSLGFGKKQLVEALDLRIARGDRVGLVGPNGSGKSSLLKIFAGELSPDGGQVRTQNRLRVGYLPQDLPPIHGETLLSSVIGSVPGRSELDDELRDAEAELSAAGGGEDEERMMAAAAWIADLHERAAAFDLHYSPHEAKRILAGLGFAETDHERDLGQFSGGWRMRAALAALLYQRPELLLLDEPTNHLDLPSVAWFSSFLRGYSAGFVLICHDREFLNEQIGRVVSLEPEGVRQFRGNWEQYTRHRAEQEQVLENQARNLAREREKAEQFITRFRAQANKAKAVQSRIKQLEKMDAVQTFERRRVMQFRFPEVPRTGNEALRIEGLRKSFGDHVVLDGVDLRVARGERIGIIGVNGAGKTTLLRTIAGELKADAGTIAFGHRVEVGYYAQHHADTLDANRTIFEEIAACDRGASETSVRTMLGAFLFSDDDVDKPISVLSGGERARVALARLLIAPGSLIMMDEPTNHLDLESAESLAASLGTFGGTLIFVSHNRSFVRSLATRIWDVAGGRVETYPGSLDEYLDRCAGPGGPPRPDPPPDATAPPPTAASESATGSTRDGHARTDRKARKREEARRRAAQSQRLGPLKKKIETLEAKIEALEVVQRRRNLQLADPDVYRDTARHSALLREFQLDAEVLAEATDAWELATAELEEAQST